MPFLPRAAPAKSAGFPWAGEASSSYGAFLCRKKRDDWITWVKLELTFLLMMGNEIDTGVCMDANDLPLKQILSLVRKGDYAHAGETEAIDLAFKDLPKNPNRNILDAGCGLGGTANYVYEHGFGKVIGIDKNPELIAYACHKYLNVDFKLLDLTHVNTVFDDQFDLVYMFNVLYLFYDKVQVLSALRKVAKQSARLILFDYTDRGGFVRCASRLVGKTLPSPINLATIENELLLSGWKVKRVINLDREYEIWYRNFLNRVVSQRESITAMAGEKAYRFVLETYSGILEAIENRCLGGAMVLGESN